MARKQVKPTTPKPPAKRGRKPKDTPDVIRKVAHAIRLGATYKLAANYAGISEDSFYDYLKANSEFFEAVKKAEGEAAEKWLDLIEKSAGSGNWQAAAWKLERRYPEQYGRSVVENRIRDLSRLSDEELEAIAKGKQ